MNTSKFRLKTRTVRQMPFILIVLFLLFATVVTVGCESAGLSRPFDSSAPTSVSSPSEPSDSSTTGPQSPTTTPTGDPWSYDIDDFKNSFHPPVLSGKSIPFSARILRTPPDAGTAGISTDPVIIYNIKQLSDFFEKSRCGWQFSDDDTDQLLAAYDDKFFLNNVLIVGAVGMGSGSIQVDIEDVIQEDETLTVVYQFEFPEVGTCDMMSWHFFIEISADDAAERTVAKSYLPNVESPTFAH